MHPSVHPPQILPCSLCKVTGLHGVMKNPSHDMSEQSKCVPCMAMSNFCNILCNNTRFMCFPWGHCNCVYLSTWLVLVLHICKLPSDCLSLPLLSLSFSVHISHFISRFPASSLVVQPNSHMLSLLRCPFWRIWSTQSLIGSHSYIWPNGGTLGTDPRRTFSCAQI
jgi:hypothetical protein